MGGRKSKSQNLSRQKYKAENRKVKNKAVKKARHEKLLTKQMMTSEKRLSLQEQACAKLKLDTFMLKRLIGTPNSRRLQAVIDGTFRETKWFIDRERIKQERRNARKNIRKARRVTESKDSGKETNSKGKDVSTRPAGGDEKVQVDRK